MISVIIPYSEDQTYLVRCLNSIKRQTYKDVEIILISKELDLDIQGKFDINWIECESENKFSGLNQAIRVARGDYLFFCAINYVLTPNVLQALVQLNKESERKTIVPTILEESGNKYIAKTEDKQSICGILFEATAFDSEPNFYENYFLGEDIFIFSYLVKMNLDNWEIDESIKIYETCDKSNQEDMAPEMSVEEWKEVLTLLNQLSEEQKELLEEDCIKAFHSNVEKSGEFLIVAETLQHSNYVLMNIVANDILPELWYKAEKEKDKAAYECIGQFMEKYEEEDRFFDILLRILDFSREQYTVMKQCDYKNALFFIEQCETEKDTSKNISILLNDMKKNVNSLISSNIGIENELGLNILKGNPETKRILSGQQNGLTKIDTKWYLYRNGAVDYNYEGLVQNKFGWYFVRDGVIDYSYNGVARNRYGAWCVEKGEINRKIDGFYKVGNTEAYFVRGKVDESINGFINSNKQWRYYSKGYVDEQFDGLVQNEFGWWYVQGGKINKDYCGLVSNQFGWWYVKDGTIDYKFVGYALNDEGWQFVKNGTIAVDESKPSENVQNLVVEVKENDIRIDEVVVGAFAEGKLGLKMVFKAFSAWLGYKFGKKANK